MLLADQLRDRYPDFKLRMRLAIAESSFGTTMHSALWIDPRTQKRLDLIAKNIDRISYSKGSQVEKALLFDQTIILFSQAFQRLYFFNRYYENFQPLQKLYGELVELMPSKTIQLQLEFDLL